jgi:hypothetical protein
MLIVFATHPIGDILIKQATQLSQKAALPALCCNANIVPEKQAKFSGRTA